MSSTETLPGEDAGRDSACHYAAVGIFGVAALAIVSLAVTAYAFRDSAPLASQAAPFAHGDDGFPMIGIAGDMPTLRPSLGADDGDSITVFDGATGRSEVMSRPGPLDTADAAHFTGADSGAALTP
ncbi:hypothetical protein [Ancylobacter sp.]|uniref:hypothetical protein n=1 Tax=Ancylobacter sp. TaxID=1872567 RepID=UPI003D0F929B